MEPQVETVKNSKPKYGGKQKLIDAFLSLLKEKHYLKITVTDVSNRAEVNRATFYRYFKDVFDLMEYVENACVESYCKGIENLISRGMVPEESDIDVFLNNRIFSEALPCLLGKNGNQKFLGAAVEHLANVQLLKLKEQAPNVSDEDLRTVSDFITNGSVFVFLQIIANSKNQREDIRQMLGIAYRAISSFLEKTSATGDQYE